jgi:anti-sigma B factor antagonist
MPDAPRPDIPAPRPAEEFAEPLLRVTRREAAPGVVVVEAEGELEALTADDLDERVREQLAVDRDVVLDLDGVTFMASSGIAVLLGLCNESGRRGARLHLTGSGNKAVARPVQVLGLESVLPLQRDPAAVIAGLPARP